MVSIEVPTHEMETFGYCSDCGAPAYIQVCVYPYNKVMKTIKVPFCKSCFEQLQKVCKGELSI